MKLPEISPGGTMDWAIAFVLSRQTGYADGRARGHRWYIDRGDLYLIYEAWAPMGNGGRYHAIYNFPLGLLAGQRTLGLRPMLAHGIARARRYLRASMAQHKQVGGLA